MLELNAPWLYEDQDGDKYYTTNPQGCADVEYVNLNAVTYYARLGMKAQSIAKLVGVSAPSIWNINPIRQAYEAGRAYHQLDLRVAALRTVADNPNIALALLDRAVGKAEVDALSGENPDEVVNTSKTTIKFEIESTANDPEIQALRDLVEARVKEAEGNKE
jgi:hypothetical protein